MRLSRVTERLTANADEAVWNKVLLKNQKSPLEKNNV
jgi:hypothetical protein